MRPLILSTLGLLALASLGEARPLSVHVYGGHRVGAAAAILVREGILTPQQAACAEFRPGPLGSRRVEEVAVFERHDERCPGPRQPPTFLFDVYVDLISGVVDYTPETSEELKTIVPLPRAAAAAD